MNPNIKGDIIWLVSPFSVYLWYNKKLMRFAPSNISQEFLKQAVGLIQECTKF